MASKKQQKATDTGTKRPALDTVKRDVAEAAATLQAVPPGGVANRQLDAKSRKLRDGTTPHFVYYVLDPPEMKAGRLERMRDVLASRGYWLADGDEYVPTCSTAEVWMTYHDVAEDRKAQRLAEFAARQQKTERRMTLQ